MTTRSDSKEPRARNAAETKLRILESGETEFAAKGFDGARLGAIARAAHVQQALIHHYFIDKAGLYRAVVDRALSSMTTEGWDILARSVSTIGKNSKRSLKLGKDDVRPIATAFIELLQRFFLEHGPILAIVRLGIPDNAEPDPRGYATSHEAALANDVLRTRVKPVVEAVMAYLDALKGSGDLRPDIDVRQLTISAISMVAFPMMEQSMLRSVWPVEPSDKAFLEASRHEIVETLLLRLLP